MPLEVACAWAVVFRLKKAYSVVAVAADYVAFVRDVIDEDAERLVRRRGGAKRYLMPTMAVVEVWSGMGFGHYDVGVAEPGVAPQRRQRML